MRAWVRYTGVANSLVSGAGGAGAGKAIGPMAINTLIGLLYASLYIVAYRVVPSTPPEETGAP